MTPSASTGRIYFVDDFEIDDDARTVSRRNMVQRLPGRSFNVLIRLIEQRQDVVDAKELVREFWNNDAMGAALLSSTVKQISEVLLEDGNTRKYITRAGGGYQFTGSVLEGKSRPEVKFGSTETRANAAPPKAREWKPQLDPRELESTPEPPNPMRWAAAVAMLLVAGGLALALWMAIK